MTGPRRLILLLGAFVALSGALHGQTSSMGQVSNTAASPQAVDSSPIIPGDIIGVHVYDDNDLDGAHLRVTDAGTVPLLLIGSIKVSGLTPAEAANAIAKSYMDKNILRNAHIQVSVERYNSSDATVIGYVNGLNAQTFGASVPLSSPRPLLTVLALAGGLSDRAARTVVIQHRDPSRPRETAYIPNDPTADLDNDPLVYPGDIVVVPRAGLVYILGNVSHPQAVVMNNDQGQITLLQALTDAGGPTTTAALRNVKVFRKQGTGYQELTLNVGKILDGKDHDIELHPDDAIWVPFSYGKNILVNSASITAALTSSAVTGIIYTH